MEEFPLHVLRDYALIADGERGALIGPRGDIVWMCAPRWGSDAVFSRLIGGEGIYAITPTDTFVWGGHYEDGSLVWRSRWVTNSGITECCEALAFPADPSRLVVLRQVVARQGPARVKVVLDPRAGFGRYGLRSLKHDDDGIWTARVGDLYLRWSGAVEAASVARRGRRSRLELMLSVPPGDCRNFVLEMSSRPLEDKPPDTGRLWNVTRATWAEEIPPLEGAIAVHDARSSLVVLRGLTASTGGMVAAATMSLPERAEQGRNYDYRYAWIRDQSYAGQAAAAAGAYRVVDAAVRFITERLHSDGPKLAPAYTVDGQPVPEQRGLDLPGYPGGFDIVGNWVKRQFQLDGLGEALQLLAAAARCGRLDDEGVAAAEIAADAIAQRWQEPDAGIWEIDNQRWTHSRLTCVAGLRAAARHCGARSHVTAWSGLADAILARTAKEAMHPSGRWQRSPDDPALDAALLLPPVRGALPADDPRTQETLRAYAGALTEHGFAYRFQPDERPLGEAEGAFLLCGFFMALALHQQGEQVEAARWFERTRSSCGVPGLFSEEYDVTERQLRGNLPQAFVHATMLESAVRLAGPWAQP
ncbi:MAG TPA: glycoside hydrolase family 15 protein [Streptosporangiaceae bacterium]|nr:glycoside hydrolase family 15 protein [Streptosporangiaceae bacterium]